MIWWQPLEQIRSLKFKWIVNRPIFDMCLVQFLPDSPSSWGIPSVKSPTVCWCVWVWKYFTTLLPLSKGSSCYISLNIIWGVFLVWTMISLWFSQTQHVGHVGLRGWGVIRPHWVKTPTHPSWISTELMRCFIPPLVSLCDFSLEKRCIVTLSCCRFWVMKQHYHSTVKSAVSLSQCLWRQTV